MCFNIRQCHQVIKNHSIIPKMRYWMIQRSKNEVFGHFVKLGLLDGLDIAYHDSTKCFSTFRSGHSSWKIIQNAQNCIFEWSKEPFHWVWLIRLTWYCILLYINDILIFWFFHLWFSTFVISNSPFSDVSDVFDVWCFWSWARGFYHVTVLNVSWGQASNCWLVS